MHENAKLHSSHFTLIKSKEAGNPASEIPIPDKTLGDQNGPELTLCVGRSLTGTLQTWLLAFLDAGIAGEQTGM